jgi:hypothetical membrane protein
MPEKPLIWTGQPWVGTGAPGAAPGPAAGRPGRGTLVGTLRPVRRSLVPVAAVALVVSGLGFLLAETVAAAAWQHPPYDYVRYFISDLGSPQCGPFQGRDVCSPRHGLMNAMFVLQGVLFAAGGGVLSRLLAGRARTAVLGLSLAQGLGVVLVGICHSSPAADADGTALVHGAGAVLAILGGNAAAVVTGLAWRRAGRRAAGTAGIVLGGLGLAGALVLFGTWSLVPPGVPERVAVYPFQAWQVMAGALLLRARPPR